MERSLSEDVALSVGCACALLGCVYLLARGAEPQALAGVLASPPIGRVNIAAADIRRRPDRTLVWETLRNGDNAYAQDTLFVPPGADAQLVFTDGTTLELSENSLVVVEASTRPRVHLSQGGLIARDVPRALEVDTASGATELTAQSAAQVSVHGAGTRLDVFSGQAHAGATTIAAGQARELATGEAAPAWTAILVSPARNQRVFVGANMPPITLLWKHAGDAHVQVSATEDFAQTVLDDPAHEHLAFTAPAPGIYYWRIVDLQNNALSETRRMTLVEDKPPEPLRPAMHEIVSALPSHMLAFAWTPASGAEHYRLELATSTDFSTLIAAVTSVSTVAYVERDLAEGTYYWRVRVDPSERPNAPYSRSLAFRLVTKPILEAPKLLGAEVQVTH